MKKSFSLKDHLFNKESVAYLAERFAHAHASFDTAGFVRDVMAKLPSLELKERIVWIAEILENYLPKDFKRTSKIILKALPEPLDPSKTDDDFGSFIFAPLGVYVVRNGLAKESLEESFRALLEITQRFSMEDSIRYFLNEFPEETLAVLHQWSVHPHYHVRRLVSEGTRPLLPWSGRLKLDQKEAVPFLDTLHSDSTRFVTRSVANHLNDISKKNPELVITLLKQWKKVGKQDPQELEWMARHALRTLVKQGNADALQHLGYYAPLSLRVARFKLEAASKKIKQDGMLAFSFEITVNEDSNLMIDYAISFMKANGKNKPKVFKIKKAKIQKGETVSIAKIHRFRADATTYTLYPGKHAVTLQVNGIQFDSAEFEVIR